MRRRPVYLTMLGGAHVTYFFLLLTLTIRLQISPPHVFANTTNGTETCTQLYEKGVRAYLDNRFDECVVNLENALQTYKDYTKKLQNCRLKCRHEADLSERLYPIDVDDLLFYERTVKATLCIIRCKKEHHETFSGVYINRETENLFDDYKPYEYLQLCYYQTNELQKAANAAFTYITTHPDDKIMISNLKHYSKLEGVDMSEITSFEAKDHVYLYVHGVDAYDRKDWSTATQNMEESLLSYLQSEDECRVQCEGPFDQGWYPDFLPSIANHFTFALRCKQKCRSKLNSLNGEIHDDLLPSHYHYLQYAYFKRGNLKAACRAVESYLLFYPEDQTMLYNKDYYSKLPKANKEFFKARPEAVHYVQRYNYEQKLIDFIFKEFKFQDKPQDLKIITQALKYRVIMTEKQLKGPNRFLSDGLATNMECQALVNIIRMFAILGDGYQGKKSPHTLLEKFEGVTLSRATLLVYLGLMDSKYLQLLLDLSNHARKKVKEYFHLKKLYFTYTHLVCRSALKDSPHNRTDFSHSIHADNCIALSENSCAKLPPAFTWRDFSAILYLNDNFEGGEFIFSEDKNATKVQSTVRPKCGRMVAFSSGVENLHGVRAVKRGTRCAIGLWFTLDAQHKETERNLAHKVINFIRPTVTVPPSPTYT